MTLERKKNIAETIQELYLYPDCSKQECTIRICAWMISWIFGVVVPETISAQALGGCYFVLSISLLVDFLCKKRTCQVANVVYGLFCTLLILTALGAIILIAKEDTTLAVEDTTLAVEDITPAVEDTTPVTEGATSGKLYIFVSESLPRVGIALFVIMLVNLVCILTEVHKLFYNEEEEAKREKEKSQKATKGEQETIRAEFIGNMHGLSKGGEE